MIEKTQRGLVKSGYVLQETDTLDVYYFYRQDNSVLTAEEINKISIELYEQYMLERSFAGEIANPRVDRERIKIALSRSGKVVRLTLTAPRKTLEEEMIREPIAEKQYDNSLLKEMISQNHDDDPVLFKCDLINTNRHTTHHHHHHRHRSLLERILKAGK